MLKTPFSKNQSSLSMRILQFMGSLNFAIFLISALGLTLIVSTSLESYYGTPFVQKFFYQSGWFDVFLALLALNILFSAILRFPYKRKHTGFVMTHAGILILLIGSLMTRLYAVDGQMMLYEGEKKDAITQNAYELFIHEPSGGLTTSFALKATGREIKHPLNSANGKRELVIHRVWDNALLKTDIENSSPEINHAAQITLSSDTTGAHEHFWLIENNPLDPEASRFSMGPAVFEIAEKPKDAPKDASPEAESPKTLTLRVYKKGTDIDQTVDLEKLSSGEVAIGKSGFKISDLKYYPDARVGDKNELVSVSENAQNPAVEFDIVGPDGNKQHFVKFAMFPDFESMHGKSAAKSMDFSVEMTVPKHTSSTMKSSGPSLSVFFSPDGSWSYRAKTSKSSADGELKSGQIYQTGWMDFAFSADNLYDHAAVLRRVERAPASGKGQMAAEISIVENDKTPFKGWVLEDDSQTIWINSKKVVLAIQSTSRKTPFTLELKDFRKVDYPGTRQPSSYESDVILTDASENASISKTISMNKPLDYKGFRIFQSSYIQNEGSGEASIFTIAKNPGIDLIYGGCIVMFLGIFLVFFIPPFSSMLKEEKK